MDIWCVRPDGYMVCSDMLFARYLSSSMLLITLFLIGNFAPDTIVAWITIAHDCDGDKIPERFHCNVLPVWLGSKVCVLGLLYDTLDHEYMRYSDKVS